jgi:hippurate hydrolase
MLKNGDGPVVMYRADMDCNSVKEITGLPYASTKTMKKEDGTEVPVMHACGHDAHVTWLLGIAKIMMAKKSEWKGTLVFIGQPAAEVMLGAEAMVRIRCMKKSSELITCWATPGRPCWNYLQWYGNVWQEATSWM